MLTLENAIVIAALVWGGVELIKHLLPSFWERETARMQSAVNNAHDELDARITTIENKLGLK